jgi:hypothetical protein
LKEQDQEDSDVIFANNRKATAGGLDYRTHTLPPAPLIIPTTGCVATPSSLLVSTMTILILWPQKILHLRDLSRPPSNATQFESLSLGFVSIRKVERHATTANTKGEFLNDACDHSNTSVFQLTR